MFKVIATTNKNAVCAYQTSDETAPISVVPDNQNDRMDSV
jgi:hypothetical protein